MKARIPTRPVLLTSAALGLAAAIAAAQPPGPPPDGGPPDGPPPRFGRGGMAGPMGMPGPGPLMIALDTDRDGVLSAEEIRKAPESLKALDRDRNGRIDRSEIRPGAGGRGGQAQARRGPGGRGGFGPPPEGGPDGFGPPPGGPGGPGGFGPGGPGGMGGGYPVGTVLPPAICQALRLDPEQRQALHSLEANVRTKLGSILTPQQMRQCEEAFRRGPGGPQDDDGPPVRPGRPD